MSPPQIPGESAEERRVRKEADEAEAAIRRHAAISAMAEALRGRRKTTAPAMPMGLSDKALGARRRQMEMTRQRRMVRDMLSGKMY